MTDTERSEQQARSQLESIREMVAALNVDYDRLEKLRVEMTDAHEGIGGNKSAMPFEEWLKETAEDDTHTMQDGAQELLGLLEAAGDCADADDARSRIEEDPLSVEVRSGWHAPGGEAQDEEFTILLCTGGPACRIIGDLDRGEPCEPHLEHQDWYTPWTELPLTTDEEADVLAYCRCFYFGE